MNRLLPRHPHIAPLLLLMAALLAGGCTWKHDQLSDDTFVEVMIELHLVDARRMSDADRAVLRSNVFSKYRVSESDVRRKLNVLDDEPEQYAELYARIVDRLTEEAADLSTLGADF